MSSFAAISAALEALVRASQAGLAGGLPEVPAGELGYRRGYLQQGQTLSDDELPHVFERSPVDDATVLPYQQRDGRLAIQFDLWTRESRPELATRVDALQTALLADTTLGGLVDSLEVTRAALLDAGGAGKPDRVGIVVVSLRRIT